MNGSPWMMHIFFTKEGALWFPTSYDSWLTTNGNHQHATLQDGFLADCFEWRHKWGSLLNGRKSTGNRVIAVV